MGDLGEVGLSLVCRFVLGVGVSRDVKDKVLVVWMWFWVGVVNIDFGKYYFVWCGVWVGCLICGVEVVVLYLDEVISCD